MGEQFTKYQTHNDVAEVTTDTLIHRSKPLSITQIANTSELSSRYLDRSQLLERRAAPMPKKIINIDARTPTVRVI